MAYLFKPAPKSIQKTSAWSGGTTTELAIFPEGASYTARDFQWRLSTAVVTAAESTFTALPDWHRLLMVLAGSMQLTHTGHHQITLDPFEQDRFSGSWTTHCCGAGQDFNLMLAAGWQGSLQARFLAEGESITVEVPNGSTEAFYCYAGQLKMLLPPPPPLPLPPSPPPSPLSLSQPWPQQPRPQVSESEIKMGAGDFLLLQPVSETGQFYCGEVRYQQNRQNGWLIKISACNGQVQLIQASIRFDPHYQSGGASQP